MHWKRVRLVGTNYWRKWGEAERSETKNGHWAADSFLVFDRILCGKQGKRLRQLMAGRSNRHGVLHGL